MSAQTVQEPGVELGEVQVNDMGPLLHIYDSWVTREGEVIEIDEVALCGHRCPDPSHLGARDLDSSERLCATCRRLSEGRYA